MNTILASAVQFNEAQIAILVDAAYAASLQSFLKTNGAQHTAPTGVIYSRRRDYIDFFNNMKIEEETLEYEIIATGTLEDFSK